MLWERYKIIIKRHKINARNKGIKQNQGVGPFYKQLKLTRKLKLNENGIFVFFRFNEKKELIEIKLNGKP